MTITAKQKPGLVVAKVTPQEGSIPPTPEQTERPKFVNNLLFDLDE
jgi:hypothetical protein